MTSFDQPKNTSKNNENELFKEVRSGSMEARDHIIKKYSALVASIARKYHHYFKNIDINELIAEGNRGLLEALDRYDESMPAKFSTYAWFWIVKNIQEYISTSVTLIGIPYKVMAELKKIVDSMEEEMKKGNDPSLEDISKKVDMDLSKVKDLLYNKRTISTPLSLDRHLDSVRQEGTLGDVVSNENKDIIQEILDKADQQINVEQMLEHLDPTEAEVIKWRFGFNDNKYHSFKEVGEKLNISPSKIKDIELMAIYKLKKQVTQSED